MSEAEAQSGGRASERVFLLVVDESEELRVALKWACLRAKKTGARVGLLYVTEPADFQHWAAVEKVMQEERRQQAEERLQSLSEQVSEWAGAIPVLYVREGSVRDELLKLIDEEPCIKLLVLGASAGTEGPGPLVSSLAGKMVGRLHIPLTVVPGGLTEEDVDAIA